MSEKYAYATLVSESLMDSDTGELRDMPPEVYNQGDVTKCVEFWSIKRLYKKLKREGVPARVIHWRYSFEATDGTRMRVGQISLYKSSEYETSKIQSLSYKDKRIHNFLARL